MDLETSLIPSVETPNNTKTNSTIPIDDSLSEITKIFLVVAYSTTTLFSVVGNSLAILVFLLGRRSKTDLRWFFINLAVTDLVMALFCMPFTFTYTMLQEWVFSVPMCPFVLYMQCTAVTASVCTITAIGVDRFWVVYYPVKSRITKSRSKSIIVIIWIVSCLLHIIQLFVGKATQKDSFSPVIVF